MNLVIFLLYIIPKNLISQLVGLIVRMKFPAQFQRWLNEKFVDLFKIDMSEAEKTLENYDTIEDVFTRALKPGLRPIASEFCSPCDGTLAMAAGIDSGTAIQAKGFYYDASELITGTERSTEQSDLKNFITLYLAPHNYHRVHAPTKGQITDIYYLPGELWPVNRMSIENIPRVFTRNERLSFRIEAEQGGVYHLVMVGAFNVGRMTSPFLKNFASNERLFQPGRYRHFDLVEPVRLEIGDEIGTFMLGSTVVLVMDENFVRSYNPIINSEPRTIKLGESILA